MKYLTSESKEDVNQKDFLVQSITDKGCVRENNEDFHGHYVPKSKLVIGKLGSLFIISDGVGGNVGGEVASAESVNVLLQEYYFGQHSERIPKRLKEAVHYTAMHIYDLSTSPSKAVNGMKCTLSALLVKNDKFYISHVGDSKIFLIRSNKMTQLTKDHSLVGKLERLGLISSEQARVHPNRHILLKALGDQPIMLADFYSGEVLPNDIFCLITDGVLEHETQEELNSFLQNNSEEGLKKIISEMNRRGGSDNMTIMTVKVNNLI